LFYYENGRDFDYYNSQGSYSPDFDIVSSASAQQRQDAERLCTANGVSNARDTCAYDYYATGNARTARDTLAASTSFSTASARLGLFIILLSSCY